MAKRKVKKQPINHITILAYFHRYGWMVLMLLVGFFIDTKYVLSIGCVAFSIWTFLGYIFRWKHIYCSYQNAYHMPMTPDKVRWDIVKKSDAYGVPALFLFFGIALFLVRIW